MTPLVGCNSSYEFAGWGDSGSHLWMLRYAVVLTHPVARASNITDASNLESPLPP